jgi:virginiamycin B lyase
MSTVAVRPRPRTLLAAALALAVLASLALTTRADAVVYVVNGNGIARTNMDGTGRTNFITGQSSAAGIALTDTHIYWTRNLDAGTGDVRRARLDGTNVETVVSGLTYPQGLAVDDTYVYYGQSGEVNLIGRAKLDGTEANNSFITGSTTPNGIAVNGTHIFWSNFYTATTGSIGRASIDGSGVNQNFISGSGLGGPNALAINSTHIYWGNFGNGFSAPLSIGRASLDGTGKTSPFASTSHSTRGVAVTDTHLYWSNFGIGMGSSYGRLALDDPASPNQSFITGTSMPHGIAVNALRGTSTTVDCVPAPRLTVASTCTATVTDTDAETGTAPTGTVAFTATGGGSFSDAATCTLAATGAEVSSCSVEYTPAAEGADTVAALSSGNATQSSSRGTQALTVGPAPSATTTGVSCSPTDPEAGTSTVCTVTVTDTAPLPVSPSGTVSLESSGSGTFSPDSTCTLAATVPGSSSCTVSYVPGAQGAQTITAGYAATPAHLASSGTEDLDVQPAPPHPTTTAVSCTPESFRLTRETTCTVTVTDTASADQATPVGAVTLTGTGNFDPGGFCTLVQQTPGTSSCSVDFTPSAEGQQTVSASFAGDTAHEPSTGQDTVNVEPPPTTTATTVACTPESTQATRPTECTVTVTAAGGTAPPGTVDLSSDADGDFTPDDSCALAPATGSSSTCSFGYEPQEAGTHTIGASFPEADDYAASAGTVAVAVGPEPHNAVTNLECSPATPQVGVATTCTATVRDLDAVGDQPPLGTVTFATESDGALSPASCTLVRQADDRSSCAVGYVARTPGIHTVSATFASTAAYRGDRGVASMTVTAPPVVPTPPPVDPPIMDPLPEAPPRPADPPAKRPSNRFKIGKLRLNRARGKATLAIRMRGRGRLVLRGPGVRNRKQGVRAGMVRLTVTPNGKARRTLRRKGSVRLRVRLTFQPRRGSARTVKRTVTLRYAKAKLKGSR